MRDDASLGRRLALDPEAIDACYAQYGGMVHAYVRRYVPREDVEDVVQQVFLDLWRSRDRFDPDRRLEPWILDIAHKRSVDHLRKASRAPEIAPTGIDESVGAQFADAWADAMTVRDALAALPVEQREALVLAYFGDYTQTQIAGQLGLPVGTVKARSFRGLRALASVLVPPDDEDDER